MEGFFTASQIRSTRPGGELAPKCGACGLYKTCQSPKMKPWGNGKAGVLIVGEAPGKTEDEKGRPFVGSSGELLREMIAQTGWDFEDLRITNSIICRPPNNRMPKKGKEIEWCRPNLIRTIDEFKPRVIITLGRSALESVLQPNHWKPALKELQRWTGHRIPLQKHWVCPTWHPSFILRIDNPTTRSQHERLFFEHILAALTLDTPPPKLPDLQSKIERIYDETEIIKALRWFDERGGYIAFDYETNCLKPEYPKARIFSAAVSNGIRTVAYPWFGRAIGATSLLLRSGRTRKIASNMKFEERWTLKHLGHPVANWDTDTVIAAHVLDNRPDIASLKFQAFVQLGVPTYNDHVEPYLQSREGSHYNRIAELDTSELLLYNGMDSLLEWFLAKKQKVLLEAERITEEPEDCYAGTIDY